MDWKNQLTKTPYLVLFIALITIGVGTASALITITLDGNVNITGDADIDGNLNVDGEISGIQTLDNISCSNNQIAKFDGNNWICGKQTATNNPITMVDYEGFAGRHTSIAIGADGLPVISYYLPFLSELSLRVLHCGNLARSSGNVITDIDFIDNVGQYTSIAIGADGLPVISYYDNTNDNLKVAHCGDIDCAEGTNNNTITTVDSADEVGKYTSIAIGSDNNPVISYYDETNGNLKVVHCGNLLCSSDNTVLLLSNGGDGDDVGKFTSIAIGIDNFPVISYYDESNANLRVLHCGTITCIPGGTVIATTIDSTGFVGQYTSIAIGSDDLPVISYYDTNTGLKVAHCGNLSCSFNNFTITAGPGDGYGLYTSIAIGENGLPVISYYDSVNTKLEVLHCGALQCNVDNVITTIDNQGNVGEYTSIEIAAGNLPVISYYDSTNDDLKVAVDGVVLIFE